MFNISITAEMKGDINVCSSDAIFSFPLTALDHKQKQALTHLLITCGATRGDLLDRIARLEAFKPDLVGKGGPWQEKLERLEHEQDALVDLCQGLE
jgi:hypothetical protein